MSFLLQIKRDSTAIISNIEKVKSTFYSNWIWLSILGFIIIIGLYILYAKRRKSDLKFSDINKDEIKKNRSNNVDMDNLMKSINSSGSLYKELSRTCHPDRFINTDKHEIALELFQLISNDKRDFDKLSEYKKRAISDLGVNFNN